MTNKSTKRWGHSGLQTGLWTGLCGFRPDFNSLPVCVSDDMNSLHLQPDFSFLGNTALLTSCKALTLLGCQQLVHYCIHFRYVHMTFDLSACCYAFPRNEVRLQILGGGYHQTFKQVVRLLVGASIESTSTVQLPAKICADLGTRASPSTSPWHQITFSTVNAVTMGEYTFLCIQAHKEW